MEVSDKTFFDCTIRLDDQRFVGCRFRNVTFEYEGGAFGLVDCVFLDAPRWKLGGNLGAGLRSLVTFYRDAGAVEILAEAVAHLLTHQTDHNAATISLVEKRSS